MDTYKSDKMIILKGVPLFWLSIIVGSTLVKKWTFRNVGNTTYKFPKSSSSSSSSKQEYVDIVAGDQMITRFKKQSLIIEGLSGDLFVDSENASIDAKGHEATGKAVITVVIQEAPLECTSWTSFTDELEEWLNSTANDGRVLATIGTGYNGYATATPNEYKPEGFAHIIGKITNDIDNQLGSSNATSLTLEIASYKATDIPDEVFTAHTFEPILHRRGGGTNNITITPPKIASTKIAKLKSGRIVFTGNTEVAG